MKTKEREKFLKWYEDLKKNEHVFDFEKEIEEYCKSDVNILRRCYLNFRQLVEETCDLDPFKHCITIASACNRVFRQQFMEDNTIGLIPPQGYQPAHKYSILALQWLSWIHHQTGNRILHAMNGGEQRIDAHYVDGFNTKNNVIYEFMGCLWHGCAKCFLPDTMNPVNDTSMEDLLEGTIRKVERLKRLGYRVEGKWECEFKQELASNPEKGLKFDTPLEPREAFFWRTGELFLFKDVVD